ncbi:MAG: sugar ABC transporter permease [Armatimonadota bacterium]
MEKRSNSNIIALNIVVPVIVLLILVPAVLVLAASFRVQGNIYSLNLFGWTVENYKELLGTTNFVRWMGNTLFLCVMCSFLGVLAAATAGYAFSRFKFYGKKTGLMVLILLQMFPAAMAMVAIFKILLTLGKATGGAIGINSFTGLILVYVGGSIPFNTWLIKSFLDSIPKEMEESAYIDGCTPWRTFFKIIFPLMSPILIVVSVFNFILPYADFIFPSIVLMDESKYTLAVGMRAFILNNFSTNWAQFAAASVLGAIPILVIFFSLQRYLVEGLTKGAVKG